MNYTYKVAGMTCGNCKKSVEEQISKLPYVTSATVHLEKKQVDITSTKAITLGALQNVLSDKYTISETETSSITTAKDYTSTTSKSDLKQLYPLFLIFAYILTTALLLNYKSWNTNDFMLDFMGLFYIVFSFFKFLDYKGFPHSFKMYDPLAKTIPIYAWVYPFIELGLGLLFLFRYQITIALIATLIILGITTVGVTKALFGKKTIQCACLGTALKLPMTKATLIENSIMIVMAIAMLVNMYVV